MSIPVARLTSAAEMVASLPLTLGYVPAESLVVVCLHEPRGRVGLTMRYDLPPPEHDAQLVQDVIGRVRADRATRVLLVVYTDGPSRIGTEPLQRSALVGLLEQSLEGKQITEALLVNRGRFWSYLCDGLGCCPVDGTAVGSGPPSAAVALVASAAALEGKGVLQSREALAATLAAPEGAAADAAGAACRSADQRRRRERLRVGRAAAREEVLRIWRELVSAGPRAWPALTDVQAARLAVSLKDVEVRDLLADSDDVGGEWRALLEELSRRTPAPFDAPVCTLYAWLTYCHGAGAAVTIALERALASDPTYSLAMLLQELLMRQMSPSELRDITRVSAEEIRARQAADQRLRRQA